ncbi:aspartate aminotransferase family protein [Sandaracinus amylolyticus]|uniref:Glutamate-1-semialdehyde aminotransferase n=1 Tax=Sandaracinus amylolyticus TaxID=927083 RepID=A0A0F6YKC8_9BACT|nr:aminotransferase class III-fold pyridoxal phosphate-dependent enzyme [Sandaracinus amylolyticus]AKF08726.1 Glutamate-1-semialdehyde aminotransferase [Sandaracinus amylolyticus]
MPDSLPRPHPSTWPLDRSHALLDEARALVPGLTLSMMKRPEHFAPGSFPVYLARGRGALVEDVDGNEYVDFVCGLGATSLGHAHPALLEAARDALELGLVHSLPTELEVRAARALVGVVPGAEMARFFKTGADATSAAVRLARAITGKERVVTVGYNGWHDHFMFDTPGVPSALATLTTRLPLFTSDDEPRLLETIRSGARELAAVVISVPYNRCVTRDLLLALRDVCTSAGVLLVFDEIVTGFRLALGGAQELFDVRPDLSCFSKAMAGGMPLSAVVGPRAHLEQMERLQVSTTFGGELVSLAVCLRTIEICRDTGYVAHVASLGRALREGVSRAAEELGAPLRVLGYDAIPFFSFSPDAQRHVALMRDFQGRMARRGVLLRRDVNFLCAAHTRAQIEHAIGAARESLSEMRAAGAFGA